LRIAARVVALTSGSTAARVRVSAHDEKRIARALHRMERGFTEPLDLDGLADTAGMSKFHFLRTFRSITGQPPHRYLLTLRLAHVATRLSAEATPVATLALEAGFGDLSTFNSRFKAHFGESPTAWRRRTGAAIARR
jgi:transcriptional regulator GlxA family with amidase domain